MDDPNPCVIRRLGKWDHVQADIDKETRTTPAQRRAELDLVIEKLQRNQAPSMGVF